MYTDILNAATEDDLIPSCLKFLSKCLEMHHNKKTAKEKMEELGIDKSMLYRMRKSGKLLSKMTQMIFIIINTAYCKRGYYRKVIRQFGSSKVNREHIFKPNHKISPGFTVATPRTGFARLFFTTRVVFSK